jgi:hypothetical protein
VVGFLVLGWLEVGDHFTLGLNASYLANGLL